MGLILVDPNCTPFKLFVSAGSNKHYYYTDVEGMNWEGVYISNGSSKRRVSNSEIRRMINRHISNSFDSEKIERNDLTFDYAE